MRYHFEYNEPFDGIKTICFLTDEVDVDGLHVGWVEIRICKVTADHSHEVVTIANVWNEETGGKRSSLEYFDTVKEAKEAIESGAIFE